MSHTTPWLGASAKLLNITGTMLAQDVHVNRPSASQRMGRGGDRTQSL